MVPSRTRLRPTLARSCSRRNVVVVLPLVPVTALSFSLRSGWPKTVALTSASARRLCSTRALGSPGCEVCSRAKTSELSVTIAAAPCCKAISTKRFPSVDPPRIATNTSPGAIRRESYRTPRTSTSARPADLRECSSAVMSLHLIVPTPDTDELNARSAQRSRFRAAPWCRRPAFDRVQGRCRVSRHAARDWLRSRRRSARRSREIPVPRHACLHRRPPPRCLGAAQEDRCAAVEAVAARQSSYRRSPMLCRRLRGTRREPCSEVRERLFSQAVDLQPFQRRLRLRARLQSRSAASQLRSRAGGADRRREGC